MKYYEVLVGDSQFHGNGALTYSWENILMPGTIVKVALRNRPALGMILRAVSKPTFTTKPIVAIVDPQPMPAASLQLFEWLLNYYPAPVGVVARLFLPPSTAASRKLPEPSESVQTRTPAAIQPLTAEQTAACNRITQPGSYLLHGITGSGKTRIYLELARRSLEVGKSVIVLTPEIGLTEHLLQSLTSLPGQTHVLHSRLTASARRDVWYQLLTAAKPVIVIGPRSALFTPLQNIGLIVMDETHDQAYKSNNAPHYRTDRVAAMLAQLHGAIFVGGSATPNVEDVYVAKAKGRPIISLTSLATQSEYMSKTTVVDLRDKSVYGRSRILSQALIAAVTTALSRHEQILLFLNRRGTANAVLCSTCGWRATCANCDLPQTYHGDSHTLRCHVCGRTKSLPTSCPDCGQANIVFKTVGTKAVLDEVRRLFPTARLRRFDTDTAKPDQMERQLEALQRGEVDIIIGTQMVTKGLDLPRLAVVGVLNADSSLIVPDFAASERTYQLISQVIGRVGRGHRDGHVVLQTYSPDHPVLRAALSRDWDDFYRRELAERRTYMFPPFCYLLKLSCARATHLSAEKNAMKLFQDLQKTYPTPRLRPSPRPPSRGRSPRLSS